MIYTSFSDRLSIRANLRMQRALDNPVYQRIFPETQIASKGSGTALRNYDILEFLNTDGYFRNSTVLGSITGEALDIGVVDDPIKGRVEANSPNIRDKVWMWLTDDVFTRFSEQGALLMIMTRWHVDDPAGRLIDHFGDRVTIARYPAIAEEDEQYRRAGEPLFPELKSLEFLEQRRKTMTHGSWERCISSRQSWSAVAFFRSRRSASCGAPRSEGCGEGCTLLGQGRSAGSGAYSAGVLMRECAMGLCSC